MQRHSVLRGLLLPAVAAIGLPLLAAIALPTALSNHDAREILVQAAPPAGSRDVLPFGAMNGWMPESMTDPDGNGTYERTLRLAPGTTTYRIDANGRPVDGSREAPGPMSVLTVEAAPASPR